MTADTAEDEAILILHFSLQDAVAKGQVLFGRRDSGSRARRRKEASALHAQRREDFARTKAIEVFPRDLFESAVQKDEPYIGVFGPDAGRGDERKAKAGREEALAIRASFKEGGIPGKARSMRQQHAERDLMAGSA